MFDRDRHAWYPTVQHGDVTFTADKVIGSDGRLRPVLQPVDIFTVHYVGAGSSWLDHGDTADELAGIERNHAIPNKKPNEYNSASDSEGVTWEYAGRFRAAHSAGNNETSWGHLVVVGLELPTEQQADQLIAGVRRARTQLVAAGALLRDHRVIPHANMPGARTGCPGPLYTYRHWWDRLAAPLPQPEPQPTPEDGDDMAQQHTYLFRLANGDYGLRGPSGSRRVSGEELDSGLVGKREDAWRVPEGTNAAHWIKRELAAYDRSVT
jgi:hypothetical protein